MVKIWKFGLWGFQVEDIILNELCPFWKARIKGKELKLLCVIVSYWLYLERKLPCEEWVSWEMDSLPPLGFILYCLRTIISPCCSVLDCWERRADWRVYSEGLGVIIAFTEVLLSHEPRESHTLTCDSRLRLWKMQVEGRGYWSKNQSVQIGGLVILDKRQRQYEVQEIQIRTWGVLWENFNFPDAKLEWHHL